MPQDLLFQEGVILCQGWWKAEVVQLGFSGEKGNQSLGLFFKPAFPICCLLEGIEVCLNVASRGEFVEQMESFLAGVWEAA